MDRKFKLGFIAVVCSIGFMGCDSKTPEELMVVAADYAAKNNNEAAIIELKNAVLQEPKNADIRLMLGKLYFETGQLSSAEKELNRAQELGSKVDDVRPLLSQVFYYSDQFDETVNLSIEEVREPEALSTLNLMRYLASLRSPSDDKLTLEEVSNTLSEQDRLLAQAYAAFGERKEEKTKELVQKLILSQYRPADVEYLQAIVSYQQGNYNSAAESFTKVKQLMPVINSVNFQQIDALIKAKMFDEAEKKADTLLRINQEHPLVNFYKANIAYDKKLFESALSYSEKAIQNGIDSDAARVMAGVSAYKLNSFEKAYTNLLNLSSRQNFKNDDIQRLLTHVQLSLGYTDEAVASLKSMADLNAQDADLFAETGMKLAAMGDIAGANELLSKANQLDESNVSNKLRKAMVNIGSDENAVIDGLNAVVEQDPAVSQGWMQLAMAHVRSGDIEAALDVANHWAQSEPANGKTLAGAVYLNTENNEAAIKVLKDALSIEPKQLGAHQYLLQAYEKSKNYDALYVQAQQVLSFAPENMPAQIAIANAGHAEGKRLEAESLLRQLVKEDKDNVSVYVALAISAKLHGEQQSVLDVLAPHKEKLDSLGLMILGDTYLQLKQVDQALTTYQLWQVKRPNFLIPYLRVIGVNELKGDNEEALHLTEQALEKFPGRPALLMLKVNYLTKLSQFESAKKLVTEIKAQGGSKPNPLLEFYEGQLALTEKNYPVAEKFLALHYKNSPSFTSGILLAKAMQGNGNITAAKTLLEAELVKQVTPPVRMRHTIAEFYLQNGLFEDAEGQYVILLELEGETAATLNNLAYALQQDKQLDKALNMAQKALVLAPNSAEVIDTLAWIEFDLGNLAEAYKHLNDALRLAPNSNVIMLHLAQVQIALNQHDQARNLLNKLVKPSKAQIEQRKILLNTI